MITLGIDPGLKNIGWAVLKKCNEEINFIDGGVIISSSKSTLSQRLLYIGNELEKILNIYLPQNIGIEKIFVNINNKSSMDLAQARGAIIYVLSKNTINNGYIEEYSPNSIKKIITGNGHANKLQVQDILKYSIPNLPQGKQHDFYDAVAIALCRILFL
ncbi:MAG: crossover junction endodeoxyribonuclease RuvC [Anaplasmataceae bacterium]|nr:crossover junction endodeoxyribonuclease RuvC [Anaplasmataceae bacterium]